MVTTLKTAEQLRQMMPQAKPEEYIKDIARKLETAAAVGQNSLTIYDGQYGLNDISLTTHIDGKTLTAAVARVLKNSGYIISFNRGYGDQRDYVKAHMIIGW